MAKVDKDKASALHRAAMTMSLGANKNSIRVLYGRNVAENLDFQVECKKRLKKGFRGWSKRPENRRAFSAVIDIAVNYFGFDPLRHEDSFRKINFNRIMNVLNSLGYYRCAPEFNKIIEVLSSLKEIEGVDTCENCKRPFIVPSGSDTFCPRCRLASSNSAVLRYSSEELNYNSKPVRINREEEYEEEDT
ncbi:hypothetical protein K9692_004272 [Escherichia coli]|nr:hypothetical protein [Escherichia coli]